MRLPLSEACDRMKFENISLLWMSINLKILTIGYPLRHSFEIENFCQMFYQWFSALLSYTSWLQPYTFYFAFIYLYLESIMIYHRQWASTWMLCPNLNLFTWIFILVKCVCMRWFYFILFLFFPVCLVPCKCIFIR